jgi:Tfp pilus assembly protein PilW
MELLVVLIGGVLVLRALIEVFLSPRGPFSR